MLKQLLADWNTAVQSRKVVNGTTNDKGIVLTQNTKFRFRDVEFEMFTKLMPNDEHAPEHKRRYWNEIFVPKTNKFVPTGTFKSQAAMMAAVLCAITEGNDHEDRVAKRNQKRKEQFFSDLRKSRKIKLSNAGYTPEEVEVILNWLDKHLYDDHVSWSEIAVIVMCKYMQYITGRGLIELGIDLKDESYRHVDRMYSTIANLMRDNVKDKYGFPTYTKRTLSHQFLFPKENISYGIYTVRSAFSKIFNECWFASRFRYVTELMVALYEHMTGVSLQDKSNEIKVRQERIYEKRVRQAISDKHNRSENANLSPSSPLVSNSIGDMFGDILDVVKPSEQTEQKPKKAKKKKKATTSDKVSTDTVVEVPNEKVVPDTEATELPAVETETVTEESVETNNSSGFENVFAEALVAAGVDDMVAEEAKSKKRTTKKKKEVTE